MYKYREVIGMPVRVEQLAVFSFFQPFFSHCFPLIIKYICIGLPVEN